jgi:hypothetical protein
MRRWSLSLVCVSLLVPAPLARGQEKGAKAAEAVAKSRIVSVGLFKNGLAVVKREVAVPGPGAYRLDTGVEPVHGTFWIESTGKVEAGVKMRDVEQPMHASPLVNLQEDLGGRKVTIHFTNAKLPPVTGTLLKLAPPPASDAPPEPAHVLNVAREAYYILQTDKGRLYIRPGEVATVLAEGGDAKVTQRRPVLVLNVEKTGKQPKVFVTYLTHGLAWAPSYLVDTTDPKKLSVEMAAVVRNEMADFDGADLRLISGFPSVEFANVLSPLAARMTWQQFFQEVEHRHQPADADVLRQQVVLMNSMVPARRNRPKLGATPQGEGVDLHFQPIGPRSLLKGEALSVTVGKAKADYERVVEWTVGTREPARRYGRTAVTQDEMWDTLFFDNPFPFPMTTAPAMVVEHGQFNGQRTSYWANVGEQAKLRVTRSLSVRATNRETEEGRPNERVVVDDKTYTKIYLKGELVMNNHRKEPVKLHIDHSVRGQLAQIDGEPVVTTREATLEDVNRTHNVRWTVTLQPGEERRLTYKYSVLVYRG